MSLTIEKMREIDSQAPETATVFCDGKYYEEWSRNKWVRSDGDQWVDCEKPKGQLIIMYSLRLSIADHDTKPCHHGYDVACLICGFGTRDGKRVWNNRKTKSAFDDDRTDFVTDIRNHIAPTTKVIGDE